MKKLFIKISLIVFATIGLNACATNNSEQQLASTVGQNIEASIPHIGNNVFQKVAISQGKETGTFVGQKVISFRAELSSLQDSIVAHNLDLQKVRNDINANSFQYNESIKTVENKLKEGTTPGNPLVINALQTAQNNAQELGGYNVLLNQLSTRISSDIVKNTYVMNSIESAFFVSGAVDDDHSQLKALQANAEQTNIALNSMLNEVSNDYNNIKQYSNSANQTIKDLYEPASRGSFTTAFIPMSNSISATPVMPVGSSNLLTETKQSQVNNSQVSMAGENGFSSRPLFVVKFNKENVDYKDGLNRAISGGLKAKPDMLFDVVAVAPSSASMTDRSQSRENATRVFEDVVKAGVNPSNISLSAKSSIEAKSSEVHIYIK